MNQHVIYCSSSSNQFVQSGTEAEIATANYLAENLNTARVGDYRILLNYNLAFRNAGGRGTFRLRLRAAP